MQAAASKMHSGWQTRPSPNVSNLSHNKTQPINQAGGNKFKHLIDICTSELWISLVKASMKNIPQKIQDKRFRTTGCLYVKWSAVHVCEFGSFVINRYKMNNMCINTWKEPESFHKINQFHKNWGYFISFG